MKLNITLYGEDGRSSTRPLDDYMQIAITENEFDLVSINLHIKVLLNIIKNTAKEVVDMIETDDPYMTLRIGSVSSSVNFYTKLFKDYTVGLFGGGVVLKRVEQEGQIADTIGVFRSEETFIIFQEKYAKNDTLNTKFLDITLKEVEYLIEKTR